MNQKRENLVWRSLQKVPILKNYYYDQLDCFTEGHVEEAYLSTKIHAFGNSLENSISANKLSPQDFVGFLEILEDCLLSSDEDLDKGDVLLYIFEGLVYQLKKFGPNDPRFRYVQLFEGHAGPACEELYKLECGF